MITTSFYNDLKEIRNAKDTLIKNLNATSDIKYTNKDTMQSLAGAVLNRNNTIPVESIDYSEDRDHWYGEERPAHYPDIRSILNNAPEITIGDVVYYPLYIMLLDGSHKKDFFYKVHSTTNKTNNYYNGTGGDAYLFSDTYDETINTRGLEIGTEITHIWNADKDFKDPNDLKGISNVRWVIVYGTSTTTAVKVVYGQTNNSSSTGNEYYNSIKLIEFISGNCTFDLQGGSFFITCNQFTKYICFQSSTKFVKETISYSSSYPTQSACVQSLLGLKSLIFENSVKIIRGNSSKSSNVYSSVGTYCNSLTYLKLPEGLEEVSGEFLYACSSLKYLKFPNTCTKITGYWQGLASLESLDLNIGTGLDTSLPPGSRYLNIVNANSLKTIIADKYSGYLWLDKCYDLENCNISEFYKIEGSASSAMSVPVMTPIKGSITIFSDCYSTFVESITIKQHPAVNSTSLSGSVYYNPKLKTIIYETETGSINSTITCCYSLENIILKEGITDCRFYMTDTKPLKYVKMPTTITVSSTEYRNVFAQCEYAELWNDFDLTYCFGSDSSYVRKSMEWFKDLCVWLKNNTGLTAKTLTLGSINTTLMQQIYLTYNPENVNDITWVEEGTEGAINTLEYLTTVKNWTIS